MKGHNEDMDMVWTGEMSRKGKMTRDMVRGHDEERENYEGHGEDKVKKGEMARGHGQDRGHGEERLNDKGT